MNGFVYVATVYEEYYKAAVRSAISLKDHFPQANITLFTHKSFFNDKDKILFDNVILNVPVSQRTKMWGMYQTPYEKTLYLDSDTEVRSDRIKDVFDILNKDIMFTKIIPIVSADTYVDEDNELEYHGGVVLYNNKKLTLDLIKNWFELYRYQSRIKSYSEWKDSIFSKYSFEMQQWDQFTIWYLLRQKEYKDISHGFFPGGGTEFNYIYLLEENGEKYLPYRNIEQIIYHYTIPKGRVYASYIKDKSRAVGNFD